MSETEAKKGEEKIDDNKAKLIEKEAALSNLPVINSNNNKSKATMISNNVGK